MANHSESLTVEALAEEFNFDADTLSRLNIYHDLLIKWQKAINLVGPSTLADPWRRHFLDSAQVRETVPAGAARLIDMGSGAGFPGLVLAILTDLDVILIESDRRKCAFLREVARATETGVAILDKRIEAVEIEPAEIVTARALAPVDRLLSYAVPLLKPTGLACFLKGKTILEELTDARRHWTMEIEQLVSRSDRDGRLLLLRNINRGPASTESQV